jgi:protein-disulfide isomerase
MPWYKTGWGIAVLGLMGLLLVGAVTFSVITIKFWWQIKQGNGNLLQQQVYSGFDRQKQSTVSEKVDRTILENGDFPFLGNPNAPITIVLFGDFRCPNTKNAWPILQRLLGKYSYKVKLIYRHFPGESIHPGANKLSQIGVCAYKQGQDKYWGVHNYLFSNQNSLPTYLGPQDLSTLASETGLDMNKLNECLGSSEALIKINRDYADGVRFGVGGTPTFFINGQKIEGVIPWEAWEGFVKQF